MDTSIWPASLGSFCDQIAARRPAPAGVASSAVVAVLGLSLLIKTIEISGKRADLAESARGLSEKLRTAADEDIAAVHAYMASRDPAALRQAIDVPMSAARAAAAGIDLCCEAADVVRASLRADIGAAAALLAGAVRAILICVDANLSGPGDYGDVTKERAELEPRVLGKADEVVRKISTTRAS